MVNFSKHLSKRHLSAIIAYETAWLCGFLYRLKLELKKGDKNEQRWITERSCEKSWSSSKTAYDVVNSILDIVEKTVSKGKKVTLIGFGTFEARKRGARIGRNPQTGVEIKIPAKTVPAFTAGKKFKEMVK